MLRAIAMLKESFAIAVWQVFRLSMEETFTTCKLYVRIAWSWVLMPPIHYFNIIFCIFGVTIFVCISKKSRMWTNMIIILMQVLFCNAFYQASWWWALYGSPSVWFLLETRLCDCGLWLPCGRREWWLSSWVPGRRGTHSFHTEASVMVQLGPTWHRRQILLPGTMNLGIWSHLKQDVQNFILQLHHPWTWGMQWRNLF